jgi:hypothetical protein
MRESPAPWYVYIICHADGDGVAGPCKIGMTKALGSRLKTLQTGSPRRLILLGTIMWPYREFARDFEGALHEALAEHRLTGEWFNIDPHDAASVVACFARDALQVMGVSGPRLGELCDKLGATTLQRYYVLTTQGSEAAGQRSGVLQ